MYGTTRKAKAANASGTTEVAPRLAKYQNPKKQTQTTTRTEFGGSEENGERPT